MLTYFCYTGKILVFLINFVIQGDFLVILTLNKRKYLKFCHTERSEVSIQKTESGLLNLWIFRYAQNDKFFVVLSCHTERSEVSINLRRILKFLWIFR